MPHAKRVSTGCSPNFDSIEHGSGGRRDTHSDDSQGILLVPTAATHPPMLDITREDPPGPLNRPAARLHGEGAQLGTQPRKLVKNGTRNRFTTSALGREGWPAQELTSGARHRPSPRAELCHHHTPLTYKSLLW